MNRLILLSMKAVRKRLNPKARRFCFEVFGYDFIMDAEGRSWLIEVNTNPCLDLSSTLLKVLIPRMIDDALKLTVDTVFPPKLDTPLPDVENAPITLPLENQWELLSKF
jgi:hypothetical protein